MDSVDKSKLTSFESLGLTKPKEGPQAQAKLGQEDFMKLMLTQMNSQDPFKPMEDGEFLSQMAQFSAVSGLKDIKDSFASLSDSLKSSHALQASSMVGRKVLIPGDTAKLPDVGELKGAINLPGSTAELSIQIMDSQGQLVDTINMGSQQQGIVDFKWDGKKRITNEEGEVNESSRMDAGNYRVKAEMIVDGKKQAAPTMVIDSVESVSLGANSQGMTLNLAQGGATKMSNVKQIF
ncbi:MAG: flagellar hook assembly protein FlgD [Gammaproteobacteria bacterium]|nr:flagellar hook assembly protein FlgD [Gammaproteobacteria bacterium]